MRPKLIFVVLLAAIVGCTKSEEPKAASSISPDKVAHAESANAPSTADVENFTVDTPPEIICRTFVEFLRKGENSNAEKYLSQESIAQTRKHQLDLATPVGPNANHVVGEPMYATNQQKVAFVPVAVTESGTPGATSPSFSLMLKKGTYGWKITGILLQADGESQDLFCFENPQDVLKIKGMIDGETRQARIDTPGEEKRYQ